MPHKNTRSLNLIEHKNQAHTISQPLLEKLGTADEAH